MKRSRYLLWAVILAASSAAADEIPKRLTGTVALVQSGNTFVVVARGHRYKIQLDAAVAPQRDQPYAGEAKKALERILIGREVDIRCVGGSLLRGIRGRVLLGGHSINKQMVDQGWAWYDDRKVKSAAMATAMQRARQAARGLWQGENPISPWEWAQRVAEARKAKREYPRQVKEAARGFLDAVKTDDVEKIKRHLSASAKQQLSDKDIKPPSSMKNHKYTVGTAKITESLANIPVTLKRDRKTPAPQRANPRTRNKATKAEPPKGQLTLRLVDDRWYVTAARLPQGSGSAPWSFDGDVPDLPIEESGARSESIASSPAPRAGQIASSGKSVTAKKMSQPAKPSAAPAGGSPPDVAAPAKSPQADQAKSGGAPTAASAAKAAPKPAPKPIDPKKLAAANKQFDDLAASYKANLDLYMQLKKTDENNPVFRAMKDPRGKFAKQSMELANTNRHSSVALRALLAVCGSASSPDAKGSVQAAAERLLEDHRSDPAMVTAAARLSRSAAYDPQPFFRELIKGETDPAAQAAAKFYLAKYLMDHQQTAGHEAEIKSLLTTVHDQHAEVETPDGKLGELATKALGTLKQGGTNDKTKQSTDAPDDA